MEINLGKNIFIKRGSRPSPLSKYETYNLNDKNSIPYPIQSDIEKNNAFLSKYKKMFKLNLGYKFEPAIKGDLLMTSSCDIGNVVILDIDKAYIDDKFFNIKVTKNLNKHYLKYWIIKNKKNIQDLGQGTTFNVLYLEPFKKFLNNSFVPNLETQQEIINIIEPKEKLFLKYQSIIDISNVDKFKKSWFHLINIIEPFEKIKRSFHFKIKKLEKMKYLLYNTIHDKHIFFNSEISFVKNCKGVIKIQNQKGNYRYYSCSSNISFVNEYNYQSYNDYLIIVTRGNGICSHIVKKNKKFYATNNLIIFEGKGINCFDVFFNENKKNWIAGTAIPMITKSNLENIHFPYNSKIEEQLLIINNLLFNYNEVKNKIELIINLLIENYLC